MQAALIGFIAFMLIAGVTVVLVFCKNKVVERLSPTEEKSFELDTQIEDDFRDYLINGEQV